MDLNPSTRLQIGWLKKMPSCKLGQPAHRQLRRAHECEMKGDEKRWRGRRKPLCKLGQPAYTMDLVEVREQIALTPMSDSLSHTFPHLSEHTCWLCNSLVQIFRPRFFCILLSAITSNDLCCGCPIAQFWGLYSNNCTLVAPLYTVWSNSNRLKRPYTRLPHCTLFQSTQTTVPHCTLFFLRCVQQTKSHVMFLNNFL